MATRKQHGETQRLKIEKYIGKVMRNSLRGRRRTEEGFCMVTRKGVFMLSSDAGRAPWLLCEHTKTHSKILGEYSTWKQAIKALRTRLLLLPDQPPEQLRGTRATHVIYDDLHV